MEKLSHSTLKAAGYPGYISLKLAIIVVDLGSSALFMFRGPVLWALINFASPDTEAVGLTMMISHICAGLPPLVVAIPVVIKHKKWRDKMKWRKKYDPFYEC